VTGTARAGAVVSLAGARSALDASGAKFVELFRHGTLSVELYRPGDVDAQQPHARDELYVVAAGRGTFLCEDGRTPVGPGDVVFVAAGRPHRFVDFTPDLEVWVAFYGPPGGEAGSGAS
jgi:mannose-6-phosphate isomerase-like protein (cupin superfamily)